MSATVPTPVTTGSRNRNLAIVATAAATALGLVFFMISSVTGAAWSDTTDNTGNSWATGQVSLTDNDLDVAMFEIEDMVPGEVVENSITVTNESTVPLDVRLYGGTLVDDDDLAQHLNLKVGTTAGAGDVFNGTLASFSSTHTEFSDGTAVIDLDAADNQTYHFWIELDDDTPQTFQDTSAGIGFIWEGLTQ